MDSKLLILIGEDDENDALLIQHALKKAGLPNPTYICSDGGEIIAYLEGKGRYGDREKFPFPRMLVLDLKMPRMDGFEVLHWVRANPNYSVIPTIILSSSTHPRDVQQAYRLGANAYVAKRSIDDLGKMMTVLHDFWNCCELPELPGRESEF